MNEVFAIDLSMRSTGITYCKDKNLIDFTLIKEPDLKYEDLLIHNINKVIKFIGNHIENDNCVIVLEGLSYNSLSGERDVIDGQHWYLRCELKKSFPLAKIVIVSVKEWRSPLFTKDENKTLREAKKKLKTDKKKIKGLKGEERKTVSAFNKELENAADIKLATYNKLTDDVKEQFKTFINKNDYNFESIYDLTDSYFINRYISKIY